MSPMVPVYLGLIVPFKTRRVGGLPFVWLGRCVFMVCVRKRETIAA